MYDASNPYEFLRSATNTIFERCSFFDDLDLEERDHKMIKKYCEEHVGIGTHIQQFNGAERTSIYWVLKSNECKLDIRYFQKKKELNSAIRVEFLYRKNEKIISQVISIIKNGELHQDIINEDDIFLSLKYRKVDQFEEEYSQFLSDFLNQFINHKKGETK